MSRLYLHCVICSRKQADGLISGAAWGKAPLPPGSAVDHPSVRGSDVRACPTCVTTYVDWQVRALGALGLNGTGAQPAG